jgi:hypothetical protein
LRSSTLTVEEEEGRARFLADLIVIRVDGEGIWEKAKGDVGMERCDEEGEEEADMGGEDTVTDARMINNQ